MSQAAEKHIPGGSRRAPHRQHPERRRHYLVEELKSTVGDDDLTAYATGFLWSYDAVTTVIPGIRTMAQLHQYVAATTFDSSREREGDFEESYDRFIAKDPSPW